MFMRCICEAICTGKNLTAERFTGYIRGGSIREPVQSVKQLATEAEWVDAMLSAGQLANPVS
jgi:hypothetical protein